MRKLEYPPGAEALGVNLTAFSDNLQGEYLESIMKKHNMFDIEPMAWYSFENLFNALNEIIKDGNNMSSSFVAIGKKIGEITPLPQGIENPTLPQILESWDEMYQVLHRNGDVGEVLCEKVSDKHYKITHSVIYPDDMVYGILYAYSRRFLPKGTYSKVYYDPEVPARDYGGTSKYTIMHIEWE